MILDTDSGDFAEQLYVDAMEQYWGAVNNAVYAPLQVGFDRAMERGWTPEQMVMVHAGASQMRLEIGGRVEEGYWRAGTAVVTVDWFWQGTTMVVEERWNDSLPYAPTV